MIEFALFALLPLGLFSIFSRTSRADAGFLNLLAALAPVIGSAVGGIFNRSNQRSAQQQQIDYERQQAEQQETQRRAQFEARQQSPGAQMQRLGFNTRLGRILAEFGGRGQTPGFVLDAFDQARMPQEYTPGGGPIDRPNPVGGGFGNYLGDILSPRGAAGYFDVQGYNRGRQQQQPQAGAPSQPGGGGFAQNLAGLLPSNIRSQRFNLGPTPAADEFLQQRRQVPGR